MHAQMAECPAGNFLVVAEQKAREGLTAAAACVETLSAMNPMVDVATVPPPPATAEALGEYTAVVATRLSAADASALAAACRASGVMLFVVDVRGGVGEALCDLGPEHTFSEAKKKTLPDNEVVTEWSNATLSYPSLASAFSGPWVGLHRKLSPAFGAMRAAQAAEAACSAQPGGLSAEKRGAEAAKAQAKALGFEREDVLEAAARVLAAAGIELPPVCAVVGGMVAQEVVKAVSKKGRPMAAQTMANAFFFDAFDQRGTYATVTPAL